MFRRCPSVTGVAALLAAALSLLIGSSQAHADFVYWTSGPPNSSIARAKLNGTAVNTRFIPGLDHPHGVAVDSRYVYWTQGDATTGSIGRANLDGTGANPNFLGATNSECGLIADSNYLYFLNSGGAQVGRAAFDASVIAPDFASTPQAFCGLAVDINYLYWATGASNSVGRVPVGGGSAEPSFIEDGSAGGGTSGVAVNSQYVFWGNYGTDTIGRAGVNGAGRNPSLIGSAGITDPADPPQLVAAPSNKITLKWTANNRKKGTVSIVAGVPGPGVVSLDETNTSPDAGASAASVSPVSMALPRAEVFELTVKPTGKTAKKLDKRVLKKGKGRATVGVFIHFIPDGVAGVPNTLPVTVTLIKKGRRHKKTKR